MVSDYFIRYAVLYTNFKSRFPSKDMFPVQVYGMPDHSFSFDGIDLPDDDGSNTPSSSFSHESLYTYTEEILLREDLYTEVGLSATIPLQNMLLVKSNEHPEEGSSSDEADPISLVIYVSRVPYVFRSSLHAPPVSPFREECGSLSRPCFTCDKVSRLIQFFK